MPLQSPRRVLLLLTALVSIPALLLAATAQASLLQPAGTGARTFTGEAAPVRLEPAAPTQAESSPPRVVVPVFARGGQVSLTLPSPAVRMIGYHEAGRSMRPAILKPVGAGGPVTAGQRLPQIPTLPTAFVMPTRGRPSAATTAADLAIPADERILSPVTGQVVAVERYRLYGRIPDFRVFIRPAEQPRSEVVVMHVARVRVRPGDRVVAGESLLAATARPLPFHSQIEKWSGRMPHIHIEVRPSRAR